MRASKNIQIKYGAYYLTTPNRLGIAGMTLEPNIRSAKIAEKLFLIF